MHIRALRKQDIPAALKILKENYPHTPLYVRRARHELGAMFEPGVVIPHYIVAIESKKLIGFAGICPSWMDYGFSTLFWVNVDPRFQGAGIGTKMIKLLMRQAKKHKMKYILLTTTRPAFYRHLGFRTLMPTSKTYKLMIGTV